MSKRGRVWLFPDGIARDYSRALVAATKRNNEYLRRVIFGNRTDEDDDFASVMPDWKAQLAAIKESLIESKTIDDDFASVMPDWKAQLAAIKESLIESKTIFAPVVERLEGIFRLTVDFNDRQWRAVFKYGTGNELPPVAGQSIPQPKAFGSMGINIYRNEPWLAEMMDVWVSENVSLITNIPADQVAKMEGIISRAVMNGSSSKTLKEAIMAEFDISEQRAKLIAEDQIGKANAALTRHRLKDAGIERYVWRGVMDSRERPAHKAREGKDYPVGYEHDDGQIGTAIRCRCWPDPVFDDE
ncbi:minor capsid protein [Enterobacter asburiae]|nr:minor capsid protein [Enterobacter asburiae]